MKKQNILFLAAVGLLAIGAAALVWLKQNQNLGKPGIYAKDIPDSVKVHIQLPENVPGFVATNLPEDETVLDMLPKDTSFAQCCYTAPDNFFVNANIVLMGMDRTSIHRPEACLPSQGWTITDKTPVKIPIKDVNSYELPVMKWTLTREFQTESGGKAKMSGLYVFWFVARHEETTSPWQRHFLLIRDLLTKGVLQRWAYVSFFAICQPGQEDAAFERVKKVIEATVPKFQLPPDQKIQTAER